MNQKVQTKRQRETVSKKLGITDSKIPYLLVVGDKEMKSKSARIRQRQKGDIGEMKLKEFLEKIKMEIERKS